MCAQNMLLDFKKIRPLCAIDIYKYDKSSKNTTIYSVILSYRFRPERPWPVWAQD
jgi:hypothetical protein